MRVEVRAGRPVRRFHLELVDRLNGVPEVDAVLTPPTPSAADDDHGLSGLEPVLGLERLLHRRSPGLSTRVRLDPRETVTDAAEEPDVVVDLTSRPSAADGVWRLEYDGRPGEAAALDALRQGRPPLVQVASTNEVLAAGVPGSESPGLLVAAFDDLLAGCVSLVVGAVRGAPLAGPVEAEGPPATTSPSLLRHAVKQVIRSGLHLGYRTLYRAPHWRVGWRWVDGAGLAEDPTRVGPGWTDLEDDGQHFYADPFPFLHEGRYVVFVEDFDHRVGRGVISVVDFDDHGPVGPPRPVLTHEVHLSYPFVFTWDDEIWMIPETSAARTVELYRAVEFPDRWERAALLLQDVSASDATVFVWEGRWWMTATVGEGGSCSDALHLWFADAPTGPWTAHPANPVLIDISSARPAGRVVVAGDRLLRPVQDGRRGYGAAMALAEVVRLDETGFEQVMIGWWQPGSWWPGRRLHTLNRAGRLECIDGSAMSPRFRSARSGGPR